jgi:site-specific DNA recombinase
MPAVGYLRVSREDSEQEKIETQRLLIEGHCRLHSVSLTEIYLDDDVSGVLPFERRSDGGRLLADARRKRFDTVYIYKLDRIGRDTRLILNLVNEFEELGIRLVSLKDGESIDTASPNGKLMLTLLAGFASFERDTIKQRTRDGAERVAEEGTYMGGIVPYGYARVGERRAARIVPAEEPLPGIGMSEAEVVRWVYRHVAIEHGSTVTAARTLNERGVPTRYALGGYQHKKGKRPCGKWTTSTVYAVLTKPLYKGFSAYTRQDGRVIEGTVPALVDEALWERAQQRLRDNAKYASRNSKRQYLLRGLLRCAHCGRAYTGNMCVARGQSYPRYGCYSGTGYAATQPRCRVRRLAAEPFEAWVWARVEEFLRNRESLIDDITREEQLAATNVAAMEKERDRVRDEISGKDFERRRVFALFRRNLIDDTGVEQQLREVDTEELELHRRLTELDARIAGSQDTELRMEAARLALAEAAVELLQHDLTWEEKRRLIEMVVEKIEIETPTGPRTKGSTVNVTFHFSFGRRETIAFGSSSPLQSNLILTRVFRYAA